METNYLIHYGMPKRSGRYPWGSGKRPFQSGGGPIGKAVRAVRKKKMEKQRNANLKKAREKAAENRRLEADKQRVLKSGSATELKQYKGKLTNQELSDAIRRLELEKKVSDMSKAEIRTGMQKVDKVMKDIKTITEWTQTGTKAWNQIVDIYNSTAEGRRNPLTRINSNQPQSQRNEEERRSR